MSSALDTRVILDTLRELNERVSVPLWLFGGVAVDFMVGRWTRGHGDIDLNAYADSRSLLAAELSKLGYRTPDQGWLTHWEQEATGRRVEIVFIERTNEGGPELVIPVGAPVGIPGRYRLQPGYLDPARFGTLEAVSFRVSSPAGEWLARTKSVIAGRAPEPKIAHDHKLLETIIPQHELARLRLLVAEENQ